MTINKILERLLPLHTNIYFGDMNSDTREEWIQESKSALRELLIEEVEKLYAWTNCENMVFTDVVKKDDVKKRIEEIFK